MKTFYKIENRYSSNENTDDIGRWARILYFKGIQIAWISGYVLVKGKHSDTRKEGKPNVFIASFQFPTSANGTEHGFKFDTIEEAILFSKKTFNKFRIKIK